MLKKINRLTKEKDFSLVYKRGRTSASSLISLKIFPNRLPSTRYGFVVSVKTAKRATKRNLVKRRLRHCVMSLAKNVTTGYDCVITARPGLLDLSYQELCQEVKKLFKRARLIKD